ncbi:MAG TPA: TetR/AcrR family transcriptional regulator [Myxococcota bacterium]|nr:TetR/AcrR family transcriptional regulator [Myxococcota bacterium]
MSRRRVGSESSATRRALLDAVERLMLDDGYAAVSYRAVATRAGVTPALVQYYFPSLDEMFVATIRRRSEQNLDRLQKALRGGEHPLRVLWEYSNREATAALTTEFMALGNHRKSIRSEITEATARVRTAQFEVLAGQSDDAAIQLELTPKALLFLVIAVPKLLQLEQAVGIDAGHAEIVEVIEGHLASIER